MFKFSDECAKSELDLFYVPPTNTSIESGVWVSCSPKVVSEKGNIEIECSGDDNYIDLSNIVLKVSAKIQKYDKSGAEVALAENDVYGPVNNFMHSIFSQIEIKLNNTSIENTNGLYPYRAYINTLLNYGSEAKKSFLQSSMYFKDEASRMELININEGTKESPVEVNKGFLERRKQLKNGMIEMFGHIHCDLFNSNRYLLNNIGIALTLTRSKPQFCLMTDGKAEYDVAIKGIQLAVRKVRVSSSVVNAHNMALERSLAYYPLKKTEVTYSVIAAGGANSKIKINSGSIPNRIVLGMVSNDAFNGNVGKNPYNFKHFNLKAMELKVKGVSLPYANTLKFDFNNKTYLNGYWSLFENIDLTDKGNYITRDDYSNGYTLFAFDLSPDLCSSDHFNLQQNGDIELELDFSSALTEAICLIQYYEYDNVMYINKYRKVEQFDPIV